MRRDDGPARMYRGKGSDNVTLSVPGRAPEALEMVRVRRRDAPGKNDQSEWSVCVHSGVGVQLSYPKTWEIREDARRIAIAYPADRGVSLNLIVGTAEGDLQNLNTMALETPKQLQSRGMVAPTEPLDCKPTTFIGHPGYELSFQLTVGGRMRMARQIWTVIEGRSFILSSGCPLEQEAQFTSTFKYVTESVQLVDRSTLANVPKKLFLPKALPSLLLLATHEDVDRKFRFKYPVGFAVEVTEEPRGDAPCVVVQRPFDGIVCDASIGAHDGGHSHGGHDDHSQCGHSHGGHEGHSHGGHSHGGHEGHSHGGHDDHSQCGHSHGGHEGHTHDGHSHEGHSHGGDECKEPHEKETEHHTGNNIRTIEQEKPVGAVEISLRVLDARNGAAFMERITKTAGAGSKPTPERFGGVNAKSIGYADGDQKYVHVFFEKEGNFYALSLRYPCTEETKEDTQETVYDQLFRHLLQRFEFIKSDKEFVSKKEMVALELLSLKPRISLVYPEKLFKVQMQAGGPFLVSLIHLETKEVEVEENEQGGGGGEKEGQKEKEKENEEGMKPKPKKMQVLTSPRSIVGLVRASTTPEVSNMKKFVAMTKQQLQHSGADCEILEEKDVLIGGTRGYQLLYRANAPGTAQRMQCLQRLAILGEFNYVVLFQTTASLFDDELALALPVLDSFHTFN